MKNIFGLIRSISIFIIALFIFSGTLISQWTLSGLDGSNIRTITVSGSGIFVGTSGNGMFRSTNNGLNWVPVNSGLVGLEFPAFTVSGSNLFTGSEGNGVFISTNNGDTWSATAALSDPYIFALAASGTYIYAGTDGGGVYRSSNNGASWQSVISGLTNTRVYALEVSGTNLFAGTYGGGVFRSTDNGLSWSEVNSGLTSTDIWDLAVSGSNIYAAASGGVFRSTNNGSSWVVTGLTSFTNTVTFSGSTIFAGTDANGVFRSTNSGTSWENISTGLTDLSIWALAPNSTYLFAGTNGTGVWKRPLGEITSVKIISNGSPGNFMLGQNYPNPFNPVTNIRFDIPENVFVSIKVFDITGKQVALLVNENLQPGSYNIGWSAGDMPSGVYFYTLGTGNFSDTKKMLLVK